MRRGNVTGHIQLSWFVTSSHLFVSSWEDGSHMHFHQSVYECLVKLALFIHRFVLLTCHAESYLLPMIAVCQGVFKDSSSGTVHTQGLLLILRIAAGIAVCQKVKLIAFLTQVNSARSSKRLSPVTVQVKGRKRKGWGPRRAMTATNRCPHKWVISTTSPGSRTRSCSTDMQGASSWQTTSLLLHRTKQRQGDHRGSDFFDWYALKALKKK